MKPPPVAGALLGLLVAITPLKSLLVGDNALFKPLFSSLQKFGSSYLPCASLVLAGSLASGLGGGEGTSTDRCLPPLLLQRPMVCSRPPPTHLHTLPFPIYKQLQTRLRRAVSPCGSLLSA